MRVALISPLFESVPPKYYGGTERVVYNLCKGLTAAGMNVTLFASGDSDAHGELRPVVPQSLRLANFSLADSLPFNLKMLADVARQSGDFDVIHNHHDYWMLPLLAMTRTPMITTLHGQMDFPQIAHAFNAYPGAEYVSISDAQRRPMPHLQWIRTVYHGIEADQFAFYPHAGKYLVFLGRMSPEKRPDWAIEIARRAGVPLKMAAKIEGASDRAYFEAHVKPKIDGKFIEYVGEINDAEKSEFLGNALGMVFPIDWPEPFGLVMVESLACGTPVLARPCGAAPEILRNGITGFLDSDINVLAKRVRDLPGIDRRQCRLWVEEKFSLERMTEDYIHVYRRLTRRNAGTSSYRVDERTNRYRRNFIHPVQRPADRNS